MTSLWKLNFLMNLIALFKLPMVFFVRPRLVQYDEHQCTIRIKKTFKTRNHINSMYFGALAVGAELSIAVPAVFMIKASKQKVEIVFKAFDCEFLKKAHEDVYFKFNDVSAVRTLLETTIKTKERVTQTFEAHAFLASHPDEPIMAYRLTMALKAK